MLPKPDAESDCFNDQIVLVPANVFSTNFVWDQAMPWRWGAKALIPFRTGVKSFFKFQGTLSHRSTSTAHECPISGDIYSTFSHANNQTPFQRTCHVPCNKVDMFHLVPAELIVAKLTAMSCSETWGTVVLWIGITLSSELNSGILQPWRCPAAFLETECKSRLRMECMKRSTTFNTVAGFWPLGGDRVVPPSGM